MTSLAHQLKRLALPQNDSNLLSQRVVASVLFDPKDAASMDRSTFYALGCTGLEELMGIDPAFSEFQETLFSQASLTLERSVQSKEVNKKLDKSISLFLTRLSPYFLLKPALKCIEWLIHRFHIQLYNQDSLIACVLPYHETKVFVRVIQLLKIEDPTHKWHWLHGLQKPGVPLARGTLLTHCYKDLGFMDFICSMVTDSVKVKHAGWLRVIFSFYASTIVSALDAVEKITNSIIAKLLPFVQLGLKSNLLDYVAATYMVVCQMAVKVVMEAQLVDSLTVQLCKSLSRMPQLSREGLSCIIVLLQNQKEGIVGPKAFGYLCAIPTLVSTLQSIATVHDISPLLRYLLPHLIHSVMTQDGWFLSVFCINLQWHLFSEYKYIHSSTIVVLCRMLLEEYVSCSIELSSDRISALNQRIQSAVRQFESRYPCALDVALENHVKKMSSDHEKTVLHQFISLTMSCGKYQILPDSDTSLMLSLNHPLASVRNMAVDYLKEILTSEHNGFDEAFLKDALLERIKDDMPEIVLSALKALQLYLTFSLCRCSVLKEAVRVLDDPRIIEGNPDLKAQISWEILPFLVLTNAAPKCVELQMASCVAETTLLSQHPLTHGWAKGKHSCCFTCLLIFEKRNLILTRLCFSDEPWWNPEKMDANTCCYVHLLCRLFDVVISGASQGPLALCFKSLMQPLLQVHLNEPTTLFKFLSLLWGYNSNLGDQLDCQVSAILQTQALYVGKALLCNQPIKTRNVLAAGSSPVVPSLLVCLCSGVCEVRRAAIAVLHSLSGVVSSPYYLLVENVLKSSEEIIADPSYLSQALSKMYEEELLLKDKKKKLASIEQLLQCVQLPCCPAYTCKTLLRALQDVHGEPVLAILLPAVERLLEQCAPDSCTFLPDEAHLLQLLLSKFNEASAPLLVKDPRCLEVFIRALGTSAKPYPSMPGFQIIALEQITKPFFNALGDEKIQQKILSVLFDLLVGNKNPACAQAINSVFKAIAVDAELVANELMPVEKQKVTATVQQARRSKMQTRKTQDTSRAVSEENVVSWPRVTLILELLQHKKKLRRAECLVPALFNLLSRCLEPAAAEQENLEYTKQLILSCLLNVCQKLSPDGGPISKDVLEEDKFNVELVVQCVRMSDMPQTHHHALLLLGALAGIFPEKVLHNIMPIFTFMGSNIMRLDDTYSFQVINKTVQAVIPALIKANEGGSAQSEGNMETVVSHIVHVFVDALPHVPEHRRLPILSQLMNTLGPSRFLWVLMLLLFKQHVTQTSVSATGAEKEAVVERDQDFWISVCCEFEVKEQLTSIIRILQYLMTLPQDKEEVKKEETVSDVIFSVEANSGKDLRHFKFLSISFMAQLLASDRFVGKVADCEDITESTLQTLLEEVLRYIHAVARCVEDNADKPTAKFWRALLSKSYDILDKVNALLPMDSFIMVMRGLMGNQLASVRRKAMELLNNKLQQRTQWITVLLELIGVLLKIVGRRHGQVTAQEEEELAINRQTALYSLKLLCRNFGSGHQEPFVPVLKKAVELVADKDEEKNVMGSALLCVAEVTSTLKALAIPQLHSLMPAVLDTLKERKDLLNNEIYLLSAVTALQRVSETLPHFISPYLEDTISQVCITKRLTSCPQLSVRLSSLSTTLATKVPPRVLIPTITKCHCNRLGPLMIILKEHITHMEKDQLNNHQSELTSFFLSALDFRAQHCQGDLKKTGEIEGCVIDCLLVMVMKLSEVTFRPLFFKLFDWSKMDGASKNRLLTFYRLADSIANKLKGLFVLFAGQLVKPISELLRQLNISHTDDDEDNVTKSSLLLQYVLDCLHKIFLYDTQRFLSKERADALLGPLVDQLENMLGGDEIYKTHITKHLVPCIAQFAVAMGDDSQWKVLNYQILLKTRHSSPKVRFSALVMLLELASKLRENYMVLLPETIPFLAELMEDECEEVEQQVQKVIHEMETILGEPLQSYF
uniref:HEAT repeat-containing protein 1 n=1 Tax=Cyprinus carpio carpio TaxID=630221 RepID=A0A9J8D9A2_CYPCA